MNMHDRDILDSICYSQMYKIKYEQSKTTPLIKKVIFNDPATIVIWNDGTKTVVKCCEDDEFDPEKGLAMAISKKVLGGSLKEVRKWTDEYYKEQEEIKCTFSEMVDALTKSWKKFKGIDMEEPNND